MATVISRFSVIQQERACSQLQASALFGELNAVDLDAIVWRMKLINLHDGETLFLQQQAAEHVYLLSTGQIKLVRQAANGGERIISLITPGSTFAEAVIFGRSAGYPVSALAVGDSNVWEIDGQHYLGILRQSTDACFAIMRRLTARLHQQVGEIERLTLHTASSRLIAYLLARADALTSVSQEDNRVTIKLGAPKNVIASRLSIVPATFSRTLAKLGREGLLAVHDDEIELLDRRRLREQVEVTQV